jgi:hypothetical protein
MPKSGLNSTKLQFGLAPDSIYSHLPSAPAHVVAIRLRGLRPGEPEVVESVKAKRCRQEDDQVHSDPHLNSVTDTDDIVDHSVEGRLQNRAGDRQLVTNGVGQRR